MKHIINVQIKFLKQFIYFLSLVGMIATMGCDNTGSEPEPVTLVFSLQSATFNGDAISPVPSYSLTLDFDKDGNPNGYSSSGTATYQPTPGSSGTFSVTGDQVTFTGDSGSRTVSITGASLDVNSTTVSIEWELDKVDDGVPFEDQGVYFFQMSL